MYHNVTAKGQGLYGELKVAAQERQKLFLQEIEEHFFAPLPPAGGGRHTEQKRKRTGSAQVSNPSNLADPDFQVPANRKKKAIPTSKHKRGKFTKNGTKSREKSDTALQFQAQERNSPIPVPLDSVPPAMRALQLRVKTDGTLPAT